MKLETFHQPKRLPLAEASRLFGLTSRALRYYEERGLVIAQRDRTNARWYDPIARRRLEWISRLRRAVPLDAIAEVIRAEEARPGGGREIALRQLERRRVALEDELATVTALMAEVRC